MTSVMWIYCLLLPPLFMDSVWSLYCSSYCPSWFCNQERRGAGCFTIVMFLLSLPRGYKTFFSCSTQLSTKFQLLIKLKYRQMMFLALSLSDVVFIMLINVKIGISTFMSRINSCSAELRMEKFYNLEA